MKTKTIFLAILSLGLFFTSCDDDDFNIIPSDKITTEEISVSNFNKLDVSSPFQVQITFSETEESVVVEANENLHQEIDVNVKDDKLYISLHDNTTISGTPVLNVYIKTSTLNKVAAEGASIIEFQNPLNTNIFEIEMEGACTFTGQLHVDEFYSQLIGASKMNISGNTDTFDINAEGASGMKDFDFACDNLNADLYGASNISLTVNQTLDVSASGASNVYYKGSGIIESQNLSDTSKIVKMN
jgi:hypothetical protein